MKILKTTAILLILIGSFSSCQKNGNEDNSTEIKEQEKGSMLLEMGMYREILPENHPVELGERIKINFIDQNKLAILNDDPTLLTGYEWMYEICENTIKLTHVEDSTILFEPYFRIINNRKFEIKYLLPYPAYGPPPPNMFFEKE